MKTRLLVLLGVLFNAQFLVGQLVPNGNSGASTTAYTNGSANDPIYIWCAEGLTSTTASLTANPPSGTGPWTFIWYYHNETNFSWTPYSSSTGSNSTISNLASDGYRVQIYDAGNNLVGCYTAWVWNMNGQVTASQNPTACDATSLSGTVSANGSFTYYNPPPPESLISASTQISVCFSATHTYVSDLAYYLVGPASCGSPTILLAPNPGAVGFNSTCNSGDNVNNLCFTSTSANIYNVCGASTPLTGTFGGYATSASGNQMINWSPLYGCNAAQGGWSVQIYDCIGADVGALTNATISFNNLTSVCGSPTTITYNSGAINSVINDNSCSAASASIFQVPISNAFSTPITINASTSYLWTASQPVTIPNASTSLTPAVSGIPNGTTTFTLTATVSYGGVSCEYPASADFVNTCCTAVADAGDNVSFCSGSSAQLGSPTVDGMTYSWSPSTGLSSTTVAQPTVTLTNAGPASQNFTYTLTVTNVADGGCTATDEVVVTVNPIPVVSAGSYGPVCITNESIQLSGSPTGGTFSGIGVTGNEFNPSVGTQVITYSYTDANGCSANSTTTIVVNNLPNVSAGVDQTVCLGTSVVLSGSGAASYQWSGGVSNNTSFTPGVGNNFYVLTGTDANGCQNTDTVWVNVLPLPVASVTADTTIGYPILTVEITNVSSNSNTYYWDFGNGASATTTELTTQTGVYAIPGTYYMTLTADNGYCTDMDSLLIIVIAYPEPILHIPNVFTPNGDGNNDFFYIQTQYVDELDVLIVNRWGNVMFQSTPTDQQWDGLVNGNEASAGVYFFRYRATGLNGSIVEGHGNVTLVR
jgi:gliding motility-associated-like protein